MYKTMDHAARIEAASRNLRLELARSRGERPNSKGAIHEKRSLHTGPTGPAGLRAADARGEAVGPIAERLRQELNRGENSQRRIRSAENGHRFVRKLERPLPETDIRAEPTAASSQTAAEVVPSDCVLQDADAPAGAAQVAAATAAGTSSPALAAAATASASAAATAAPAGGAASSPYMDNTPDEEAHVVSPQHGSGFPSHPSTSSQNAGYPHSNVEDMGSSWLGDVKRPASRKKAPSASALAGLGSLDTPEKMMDAFEQRKTRHPIPIASESWRPRPPSRHGLPSKSIERPSSRAGTLDHGRPPSRAGPSSRNSTGHLGEVGLAAEDAKLPTTSPWSHDAMVLGRNAVPRHSTTLQGTALQAASEQPTPDQAPATAATWAQRGRDRKVKDFRASVDLKSSATAAAAPKEFGAFGSHDAPTGPRSPTMQQQGPAGRPSQQTLTKNLSDVFDHSSEWVAPGNAHPSTSWASPAAAAAGAGPADGLEVSGFGLGTPWTSGPNMVSVEDVVDTEFDVGFPRRDSTPLQVIVTRSQAKKGRSDSQVRARERGQPRGGPPPKIATTLDDDFLALFAA